MKSAEICLSAFLETLDTQLKDLPPARRLEIINETREHLEAMILARRADGQSENEAWHSTQTAFGEAEIIGREVAREWRRAPRIETRGTPLTKREKVILFVRPASVPGCCPGDLFLAHHQLSP